MLSAHFPQQLASPAAAPAALLLPDEVLGKHCSKLPLLNGLFAFALMRRTRDSALSLGLMARGVKQQTRGRAGLGFSIECRKMNFKSNFTGTPSVRAHPLAGRLLLCQLKAQFLVPCLPLCHCPSLQPARGAEALLQQPPAAAAAPRRSVSSDVFTILLCCLGTDRGHGRGGERVEVSVPVDVSCVDRWFSFLAPQPGAEEHPPDRGCSARPYGFCFGDHSWSWMSPPAPRADFVQFEYALYRHPFLDRRAGLSAL